MKKQNQEQVLPLGENSYFAACNSGNGFCSYYHECFDRPSIRKLYAIKGGPGTGKSRLMQELAAKAEKEGATVEKIYCSSDPYSLDGIVIWKQGEGKAYLDATAPHVYEPSLPGTREEILNLGAFWNSAELEKQKEKILSLQQKKARAYQNAYTLLSACQKAKELQSGLMKDCIDRSKFSKLLEKFGKEIPFGKGYQKEIRLLRSVGMRGNLILNSYFASAQKIFLLTGNPAVASAVIKDLADLAEERGQKIALSFDPVAPTLFDGIYFTEEKLSFVCAPTCLCLQEHREIRCNRLLNQEEFARVRTVCQSAKQIEETCLAGVNSIFREISKYHFDLETIYSATMDFSKKEAFTKTLLE